MGANPFFSVVIPTYNRASSILDAVESVLAQEFNDLEVIVVDDGSSDNTAELVKNKVAQDSRLRYIHQQNAERSQARNNGIEHAAGQYICFLDSDDVFLPAHLSTFHEELQQRGFPVMMLFGNHIHEVDGNQTKIPPYITSTGKPVEAFVKSAVPSQTTCVHSEILKEFKFDPDFRIGEDVELFCRIATKYPIERIESYTVIIRDLGDRSIETANIKVYNEFERLLKHLRSLHSTDLIEPEWFKFAYSSLLYKRALQYLKRSDRMKFLSGMISSILVYPSHYTKEKVKALVTFSDPSEA